jgi:hypothetical protein
MNKTQTFLVLEYGCSSVFEVQIMIHIYIPYRYIDGLRAGLPGFDTRQWLDFSLFHSVHAGSGAHPVSFLMGTGGSLLGGKAAGT